MIKKILPAQLKEIMLKVLSNYKNFSSDNSIMPFLMQFDDKKYFAYVKNISSAYFPERPDTTRVQLPKRDIFAEIVQSDIPFILLGYDQKNDVVVCWNPDKLKTRLNSLDNVSLYLRQSFQNDVIPNEFKTAFLTNGDKLMLFKRENLIEFFQQVNYFFANEEEVSEDQQDKTELIIVNGKLCKLTDPVLLEKLIPLLRTNHTLEATSLSYTHYEQDFPSMTFKDHSLLMKQLKKSL